MSCTMGPCPQCGAETMYEDREPTRCFRCRSMTTAAITQGAFIRVNAASSTTGNRKQRRAAKSGRKTKGNRYDAR